MLFSLFGAEWTFLSKQTLVASGPEQSRYGRIRERTGGAQPFSAVVVPFGFLAARPPHDPPRDQQEDGEHGAGARDDPGPTCRHAPLAPRSLNCSPGFTGVCGWDAAALCSGRGAVPSADLEAFADASCAFSIPINFLLHQGTHP